MAKVRKNKIIEGVSGKLGDQLVLRLRKDGVTIVADMPDFSGRVFSEAQVSHQSRFKLGTMYAKAASKAEPIYARLAAGTVKNAYNLALADFFHAPVIHGVQRVGSRVEVSASDDVWVARVVVRVFDAGGDVLAQGEARQEDGSVWVFALEVEGRLMVEVFDLAGNVARWEG